MIEDTKHWFEAAVPTPTPQNVSVQIGCHIEEVAEMLEAMDQPTPAKIVDHWADRLKESTTPPVIDREAMLDALADQIVTAVGVAHMLGMDIVGALNEVNRSNFSKFVDGKPVFNDGGKVGKGKDYSEPDLSAFV